MFVAKRMLDDFLYIFLNYFVNSIPCWFVRAFFYKLFGMKIGKGSRVNMKCIVFAPYRIEVGNNVMINEWCILDGRGGLSIGDNCSISMNASIYSASHHVNDPEFSYFKDKTTIGSGVWIGCGAVVCAGTTIQDFCVVGANSVTSKSISYEKSSIYVGIPATFVRPRKVDKIEMKHLQFFR